MTNTSKLQFLQTTHYDLRRGKHGGEACFEIISPLSENVLARFPIRDEVDRKVEADARELVDALETIHSFWGQIDCREYLAEHRLEVAGLNIEDVQRERRDLGYDEAWKVLQAIHDRLNAPGAVPTTWIRETATKLFDEPAIGANV
jgi:hypothetical protein